MKACLWPEIIGILAGLTQHKLSCWIVKAYSMYCTCFFSQLSTLRRLAKTRANTVLVWWIPWRRWSVELLRFLFAGRTLILSGINSWFLLMLSLRSTFSYKVKCPTCMQTVDWPITTVKMTLIGPGVFFLVFLKHVIVNNVPIWEAAYLITHIALYWCSSNGFFEDAYLFLQICFEESPIRGGDHLAPHPRAREGQDTLYWQICEFTGFHFHCSFL